MKIILLGTPEFAVPTLEMLSKRYGLAAVVCQPDREKDRKGNFVKGAVKAAAEENNIPVFQFEKIRFDGVETLKTLAPDLMVTCAYGQILSQEILDIPPYGVLNVHGSLLPSYRGSAPIQRALMNGDRETGVTIMKTDAGMDSGAILSAKKIQIGKDEYISDLYSRLSKIGASLLGDTIEDYVSGKIKPVPQDESLVSFAPMLKKEEAFIDFTQQADNIRDIIRGMGYGICGFKGAALKIFRAETVDAYGEAGEIISAVKDNFVVACGGGALKLSELQLSGKKRMNAADFLNGIKIAVGEKLLSVGGKS